MGAVPVGQVISAATLFSSARGYDAAGNIATVSTTLPAGTDTQAFCYDEQNRLTWASSATGSPPCGGTLTAGTLASASYTQSFAYDTFGRLTSGPLGSYSYGPGMQAPPPAIPSPLHAALSAGSGSGYTATYDMTGDMTCRAPTTAAGTCTSTTQTGQPLSYDNEGRLTHWQDLSAAPTSTADFAYDGEGQRVAQQVGGTGGTTTYYLGGLEEVTGGTLTTYLSVPSVVMAERVGTSGPLSYLATDGLGSVSAALDSSGNVSAAQLFTPYGSVRYSSGTMPTAKGYTGQRADAASGLDYYVARYYDPALGQFTSADTVLPGDGADPWGLSRYAYVEGNPEGRTDADGHCWPFCAIVAAVAVAVVATVVDVGVQAWQNGGQLDQVNWGQAATVGVAAGAVTAAALIAGPLLVDALGVSSAFGATGEAVSATQVVGGFLAAKADSAVAGGIVGGVIGGAEGGIQGVLHGEGLGGVLKDTGIGALSGAAGGVVGSVTDNPVLGNAAGNGMANLTGQVLGAETGGDTHFDAGSFVIAMGWGAVGGNSLRGVENSDYLEMALNSTFIAGGDITSQYAYRHFVKPASPGYTGQSGGGSSVYQAPSLRRGYY